MKIQRILTPKKCIQKKIAERTAKKLSHIKIDPSLANKADATFLKENIMPLASFARKNDLYLTFKNGDGLFDKQTIMEIHKHDLEVPRLDTFKHTYKHVGSIFPSIDKKEGDSKAIIESMKSRAKDALVKNGNKEGLLTIERIQYIPIP